MINRTSNNLKHFLCLLVTASMILFLFPACNTKKYLKEDELFLKRNDIWYKEELNSRNATRLKSEIPELLRINPNTGFLWIPRHWFYYRDKKLNKDNWWWDLLNKNITEEPAVIKKDVLDRTAMSISHHLRNNGYYDAYVEYKIDTFKNTKHEAAVNWYIHPENIYLYKEYKVVSEDTVIQKLIDEDWRNMAIKKGMPIDISSYEEERKRIMTLLRNNGYANFSQSYIDKLTVDTAAGKNIVVLNILGLPDNQAHPRFKNRNVFIYDDGERESSYRDTLNILRDSSGVHFLGNNFRVRPSAIAQNIRLRPNAIYSRKYHDEAQAEIGEFAIYKYPTAQLSFDTLKGQHYVDYSFFLKSQRRYNMMAQPAIYYSTIANTSQLLGLSLDLSITDRNIFGGGESFTTAIEGATELSLANIKDNSTYSFGISNSLQFPRLIRYPFLYDFIESSIPETASDRHLVKRYLRQAKTRMTLNYLYTYRSNYYTYNSFSASFGYTWKINEDYHFELDHIGFDWWLPTIFDEFRDRIQDNQYYLKAFDQRLLTGVFFRRARLNYQPPRANFLGERWSYNLNFETSGLEIMAVDGIRSLLGQKSPMRLGENQFSKYLRLDLTGTYKRKFSNDSEIAFRMSTGMALSLDSFNVPYIRQFYVGGPYSLRAWPVRGIGPGDHYDPVQIDSRFPPYFTGNFKFETNAEYRFKLFWYFHGAFFLDIGNVWNIFDDNFEGNTQLRWDSYEQIAIGSGTGLRMDLSLFVVRLDLGYPIKTPYKLDNSYFTPVETWSFKNIQWNIAFGYPF